MQPYVTGINNRKRCGFNLVEAAIVLGVIGLVIGGIWAAASAIHTEHKASQTMAAVVQAGNILRPILTRHSMEVMGGTVRGITRRLLSGKLDGFNGDVPDYYGGNYAIGTPFGPGSSLVLGDGGNPSLWPDFKPIMIEIVGVPRALCYRLLSKFRAVMQSDPGGVTFAGISTSRGSDDAGLGYFLPAPYNPPNRVTPRFNNEDTMCSEATLNINFFLVPMVN